MPVSLGVGRTEQLGVTPITETDRFFIVGIVMHAPGDKFGFMPGKNTCIVCLFVLPAVIKPERVVLCGPFGHNLHKLFTCPVFTSPSTAEAEGPAHAHIMAVDVPGIHQVAVCPVNP